MYELGVHLRRAFWKRGLAQESAQAIIEYGFSTFGAEALFAGHHPGNEASRQLLLKLGFVYTHDELYPPTGLMHPSYLLRKIGTGRLSGVQSEHCHASTSQQPASEKGMPIADNLTAAGRQKNRRVEIIVSGEVIGTRIGGQSGDQPPQ